MIGRGGGCSAAGSVCFEDGWRGTPGRDLLVKGCQARCDVPQERGVVVPARGVKPPAHAVGGSLHVLGDALVEPPYPAVGGRREATSRLLAVGAHRALERLAQPPARVIFGAHRQEPGG